MHNEILEIILHYLASCTDKEDCMSIYMYVSLWKMNVLMSPIKSNLLFVFNGLMMIHYV